MAVPAVAGESTGGSTERADGSAETVLVETKRLGITHEWQTVSLSGSQTRPVAIAMPLSHEGPHQASTRLTNVTESEFEAAVEEWKYLDGWHTEETASCVVTEPGQFTLADGTQLEVASVDTNHEWTDVSFSQSFSAPPVVLSQSQTHRGDHPVVSRNKEVSSDGYAVRLQEEEAEGWHEEERVGYVAVEPGSGTLDGKAIEAGVESGVDDTWTTIEFGDSFTDPKFLADVQTFNGPQTCTLRYRNLTGTGVEVFVEEEQSADDETNHMNEEVGYLVIGSGSQDTTVDGEGYGAGGYGEGGYGG